MLKFLIEKEFKQLWRDPFIPKLIVVLPCIVMLVFPWATTMEIKNGNLSIVDNDHSQTAEAFIKKLSATSYFRITDVSPTGKEAYHSIDEGIADAIVEIPRGFESSLMDGSGATIQVSANAVNATKASVISSYLTAITTDFSSELIYKSGSGTSLFTSSAARISGNMSIGGITVKPYYFYNPSMDYKIPMIPALMLLIVTLICGFLPSMNITTEKEIGTIEQINVSPVPKVTFILGKLIPYWIVGIIVFTLALIVTILLYDLPPVGSVFLLYVVIILFILAVSGIGLIIANYSYTLQQAMFMIFFFIIIMLLISGIFTPVESMPVWARFIAWANPLTYIVKIVNTIYLKGGNLSDVSSYVLALVGFFIVITWWAIASYKKRD